MAIIWNNFFLNIIHVFTVTFKFKASFQNKSIKKQTKKTHFWTVVQVV